MATEYSLLTQYGTDTSNGRYWGTLSADQKLRYGSPGSERVFASMRAWYLNLITKIDYSTSVFLEVYDAFLDSFYAEAIAPLGRKTITISTTVDGIVTPAFNAGSLTGGYKLRQQASWYPCFVAAQPSTFLYGFRLGGLSGDPSGVALLINSNAYGSVIDSCVAQYAGGGIQQQSPSTIQNNIIHNISGNGLQLDSTGGAVTSNLVHTCGTGVTISGGQWGYSQQLFRDNLIVKNTRNYAIVEREWMWAGRFYAVNNYGDSTDISTVTMTSVGNLVNLTANTFTKNQPLRFIDGGSGVLPTATYNGTAITLSFGTEYYVRTIGTNAFTITTGNNGAYDIVFTTGSSGTINISLVYDSNGSSHILANTAFVDYTGNDFRPASASQGVPHPDAIQVSSVELSNDDGLPRLDIQRHFRPDYESATFPVNLATAGVYEFDHSEGNTPPNYPTITISANASLSGAEIRIYDMDNSPAGSLGTELLGTESHGSATYIISTLNTGNLIWIQIMQSGYEEFGMEFTIPAADAILPITLKTELNT